jgi:F420H(2)-dependent quinone reductase
MSEAENLFGQQHVDRYRETDGAVGYIWKRGAKTLLLTTKGRKTGKETTTPLIYERAGDDYVIVASKGGAPEHPGWYRNLVVVVLPRYVTEMATIDSTTAYPGHYSARTTVRFGQGGRPCRASTPPEVRLWRRRTAD